MHIYTFCKSFFVTGPSKISLFEELYKQGDQMFAFSKPCCKVSLSYVCLFMIVVLNFGCFSFGFRLVIVNKSNLSNVLLIHYCLCQGC